MRLNGSLPPAVWSSVIESKWQEIITPLGEVKWVLTLWMLLMKGLSRSGQDPSRQFLCHILAAWTLCHHPAPRFSCTGWCPPVTQHIPPALLLPGRLKTLAQLPAGMSPEPRYSLHYWLKLASVSVCFQSKSIRCFLLQRCALRSKSTWLFSSCPINCKG